MNNLTTRFFISFGLLVIMIIGGEAWSEYHFANQNQDSRVVNISGRQRMLSQKISKVAAELAYRPDAETSARLTTELKAALALWESSQDALRFGNKSLGIAADHSSAINRMYAELDPTFAKILSSGKILATLTQNGRAGTAEYSNSISQILSNDELFLTGMDAIVLAHEHEAQTHITRSREVVFSANVILIAVMIFLWVAVIGTALRKARAVDKAKTEFVSIASHQLRNPLTSIKWYAEMMLKGDAGAIVPEQKKYLEEIYGGDQRMIKLINTLLEVSRLELGTFAIKPETVRLTDIAETALAGLERQIKIKNLTLEKHYDPSLPAISADPQLITMVFQNLLENAVNYVSNNGKILLNISVEESNILIKIWNNGIPIPKKDQPGIFTKFFRSDAVKETHPDGNGLGLYIVKSIVEKSGGKIWFESEKNRGTTFYITLPAGRVKKRRGLIS